MEILALNITEIVIQEGYITGVYYMNYILLDLNNNAWLYKRDGLWRGWPYIGGAL